MGIGIASGKTRAREAAMAAISSPLLEASVNGARGVVLNITGGSDMTLHEVNAAADTIYEVVDPNANIIFGAVVDEQLQGEIRITVIATGFTGEINAEATNTGTIAVKPDRTTAESSKAAVDPPPTILAPVKEKELKNEPTLDIPEFLQRRRFPKN
jgi:cell division protein FtsZ